MGVDSQRKEFAPSKFFPLRVDYFGRALQEKETGVTKVVPLYKNGRKHGGVPLKFLFYLHFSGSGGPFVPAEKCLFLL